jgi:hypothetical protein
MGQAAFISAGVGAAHLSLSWDEAHKTVNADWTGFFNTVRS